MLHDVLRNSVRNLLRRKLRSTLTLLGIAIGVASVILVSSIGELGKHAVTAELEGLGLDGISVGPAVQTGSIPLDRHSLETIRSQAGVAEATPVLVHYTQAALHGLVANTVVWGIETGNQQLIRLTPVYGRVFNQTDLSSCAAVCVVDRSVAQAFYHRDNIVGKTLRLQFATGNQEFTIIGVVDSGGSILQGMLSNYIPSFVYLPYTTMMQVSGKKNFDKIAIRSESKENLPALSDEILRTLNRQNGLKDAYLAENMLQQKETFYRILAIVTSVLSAIAGISLVVAGLGIMTIMMVSVNERTREIGIKKAVGASRSFVLLEFLAEAFTISALGSIIGASIGFVTLSAAGMFLQWSIHISGSLILFCCLFAVMTGVLFGVYPAMLAARMRPVDALRTDG